MTSDSSRTRPSVDLKALLRSRQKRLTDLARDLALNKSTVTRWAQTRVPSECVIAVERVTGIPRQSIRPDLYPAPEAAE